MPPKPCLAGEAVVKAFPWVMNVFSGGSCVRWEAVSSVNSAVAGHAIVSRTVLFARTYYIPHDSYIQLTVQTERCRRDVPCHGHPAPGTGRLDRRLWASRGQRRPRSTQRHHSDQDP